MEMLLHSDLLLRLDSAVHKFETFQRQAKTLDNELGTEIASESIAELKAIAKLASTIQEHLTKGAMPNP